MLRTFILSILVALVGANALAQQTGFTYQGHVTSGGVPLNGVVTITAEIYPSESSSFPFATQTVTGVPVSNGNFTVELNKGGEMGIAFNIGAERWIELIINGQRQWPRTRILSTPYSIFSLISAAPWVPSGEDATIAGHAGVGYAPNSPLRARFDITDNTNMPGAPTMFSYAPFRISNGTNQALLMDSNHIESVGDSLYLNFRPTDGTGKSVVIAGGGGNVAIGSTPLSEKLNVGGNLRVTGDVDVESNLNVSGNIRVADDADIFGLDQIVGFNDLRLYGDPSGGPDMLINSGGNVGIGHVYTNVTLNVRGRSSGDVDYFRVEQPAGTPIFEVEADNDVVVSGDFFVNNGSKNFIIDHPLDPSNSDLAHNAIEGPGYYTHYHGNVTLGDDGAAWVELPEYFQALNTDPSYQLTPIGGAAAVYVAEEVTNNRFKIAGGKPGMKVSWQVHATRHDPYAQDHPYQVVRPKQEPGKLLYERSEVKPVAAK